MKDLSSSKPAYTEMKYHDEGDPVHHPENLKAVFGNDNQEDIVHTFDVILKDAPGNGMSHTGIEKLDKLLKKHRSLLYVRLGPEEVANAPTVKIKPVEDGKPLSCSQRRYSENRRAFINRTIKRLE